jgi:hypothetical protein
VSTFDVLERVYADDLVLYGGDPGAVVIMTAATPKPLAAIVGRLRTEEVPVVMGSTEKWVHREVCQVSVRCEPGEVGQKTRMKIARYTTGDASSHDSQLFYVRTVTSITDAWTTVEAWRELASKQQMRGTESEA